MPAHRVHLGSLSGLFCSSGRADLACCVSGARPFALLTYYSVVGALSLGSDLDLWVITLQFH